jgi:cellulose synthase/poly-beta-1,6-N-acetylglucosamine synthase-like glycosyltransferase
MKDLAWQLLWMVHLVASLGLGLYGVHQLVIVSLAMRAWKRAAPGKPATPAPVTLPRVTVQLPLYNERFVAQRVIAAACALDYPKDKLQIQVLDDSTDDTLELIEISVAHARAAGHDIMLLHRENRHGFKAGALAEAMPTVTGEFIAIFDADFVPPRDFLRAMLVERTVFADAKIGFFQGRWGHLNRDESLLTRAQAAMHDGHFIVEQVARSTGGLWFNFNGSGGIWRRACIDDAGGWQPDTLAEDLDLSYRAWLRGWKGAYTPEVVAPGELPLTIGAFRRQQYRWARGSIQAACKLVGQVARRPGPWGPRLAACAHLTAYSLHPLMWTFLVTWPLIIFSGDFGSGVAVPKALLFILALLSPVSVAFLYGMVAALVRQGRAPGRTVIDVAVAALLGLGMATSNSAAVLRGVFGKSTGVFERTPKTAAGERATYRIKLDARWPGEAALALYLYAVAIYAANSPRWWWALPLAVYGTGTALVVVLQLRDAWPKRKTEKVAAGSVAANLS